MHNQSPLRRSLFASAAAAALLGTVALANQTQVSDTIPLQLTNWTDTLTIPKFDTSQGVLNSVSIQFEGFIEGQFFVQNRSSNPATVVATLSGTITLQAPNGIDTLVTTSPSTPVTVPLLQPFTGLPGDPFVFAPPTGFTSPVLSDGDATTQGLPPDLPFLTLADFQGPGTITFPAAASGSSTFLGNQGNEAGAFSLRAGARLIVTYDFTPPKEVCEPGARDTPGSLLLFPRFDNRPNRVTLVTVTNTNCDFAQGPGNLFAGTVDIEYVYIGKYGPNGTVLPCLETNTTRRLTPCDTITILTRFDNPNHERGFLYVFAKDPQSGQAIVWNHLIGQALFIGGNSFVEDPARDALNARPFLGIGRQGSTTDDDGDGIRDLDGIEYSEAPDQILIPRFLGQQEEGDGQDELVGGSLFRSRLVLVGLSGGSQFDTIIYILGYNDNEVQFSSQYQFRCWDDPRLADVSGGFLEDSLENLGDADDEIFGANGKESGWIKIDGQIAFSEADFINDPAIYAVLLEQYGIYVVCDLPWELCTQSNGDLFPNDIFEEGP